MGLPSPELFSRFVASGNGLQKQMSFMSVAASREHGKLMTVYLPPYKRKTPPKRGLTQTFVFLTEPFKNTHGAILAESS